MLKRNKQKGITLIALVVTIIVLLILSAVTISVLIGKNGIITNANLAKKETRLQQAKEQLEIAITSLIINAPDENRRKDYILENKEKLEDELGRNVEINKEESKIKYDIYTFKLKEDCSIELSNELEINKNNLTMQIINDNNTEEILKVLMGNLEGTVEWSSLDTKVATVDNNGKVTTVGEGETIIKAQLRYI